MNKTEKVLFKKVDYVLWAVILKVNGLNCALIKH